MLSKILLSLSFIFSIFGCRPDKGTDLFEQIVLESTVVKRNTNIFETNVISKEKLRKVFWNELVYFFSADTKHCLLMRVLDNGVQSLALTNTSTKGDCLENLEKPIWKREGLKNILVGFTEGEQLYIKYKVNQKTIEHYFEFYSAGKKYSGLRLSGATANFSEPFYQEPCVNYDNKCQEVGINYCEFCPYGVIGTFEKDACANQKVYCRQAVECGKSEQLACQRLKETSFRCVENQSQYFCQENLNYKCVNDRVMCF